MKLSNLRSFVAAIEEGSLRSAARRLGITQPALTKTIQELERELSAELLLRSTSGVLPTAQGKVLYQRAKAADHELAMAVTQINELSGATSGMLTVGAVPLAVMLLIPETLRLFSQEFPNVQLRVIEELYIAQMTTLRKAGVDVALGPLPDQLDPSEFHFETLMPISMMIVVRKGNPLARARRLADLSEARWVYTGSTPDSGYAKVYYELHGLKPPPAGALVNSTFGLISILAGADFVALLPQQIAMHPFALQHLETIPVAEGPLRLSLGAITRVGDETKPSARHFLAHLHRAARYMTDGYRQDDDVS